MRQYVRSGAVTGLSANPDAAELRAELDVGDDITEPQARELGLRSWLGRIDGRAG